MDRNIADCCKCHKYVQPAQQKLSDLDFDRGIWNAVIYYDIKRIEEFIEKGKTMDRDNFGYTALHYAARKGSVRICEMLLRRGKADVNAVTKGGVTALHRAAMMGHLMVVNLLIECKADMKLRDEDGKTALHRSAAGGHLHVSHLLLQKEPNLKTVQDNKGKIPYEYLPENADDELKALLKPEET